VPTEAARTGEVKECRIDGTGSSVVVFSAIVTDVRLPGRSSGRESVVCEIRALLSQEAGVFVFANVLEAALNHKRQLVGSIDLGRALKHCADVARAKGVVGNLVRDVHVHSHVVAGGREVVAFSASEESTALRVVVGSGDSGRLLLLSAEVELSVGRVESSGLRLISLEVELIVSHLNITSTDLYPSIPFRQITQRLGNNIVSSRSRPSRLRKRNERLLWLGRRRNSMTMSDGRNPRRLLSDPMDLRLVSVQPILASESHVDALLALVRLLVGVLLADVLLDVVRASEESRATWPGTWVGVRELATGESWRCRCSCCLVWQS
jgi:hypothetical protein